MNKFVLVIFIVMVAGCASTQRYASEPQNTIIDSGQYQLKIQLDKQIIPGIFSNEIRNNIYLYVNDVLAVSGPLHRDESGRIQGVYDKQPVQLDCVKPNFFSKTQCTVHIDGRNAGTLALAPSR